MTRSAGFTLVEVIVVLLILSISAAAVVPAVARRSDEMGTAIDRVTGLVSDARRLAVSRAIRVQLTLQPDGQFRIRQLDGDTLATLSQGKVALPPGVSLDTDRMLIVTFGPDGGAQGDSIPLRTGGRTRRLALDRWTGAPRDDR